MMSTMETTLQQVWGPTAKAFCTECGLPEANIGCTHETTAPWSELNVRQRTFVRRQAIRHAKTGRMFTVAS